MKVFLVANTDWYLYRFRLSLANYLRDHGHQIEFVSPAGNYVAQLESQGFTWRRWEVGRQSVNPFTEAGAILGLLRIIKREAPDLVHLHTIKPVLYGSFCALFQKRTLLVQSITGRGYVFQGEDRRARLLRPLIKSIFRIALNSDRGTVIFENETDRDFFILQRLVRSERTSVVQGVGVDTDYYSYVPEPAGVPIVVLAGRMLWDKGVGTFVDAARMLHNKISVRFVLVGEPDSGNPASIPVETLKTWENEGVIEWWGWQADMRHIFSICHIVTLPSFGEGLPTILLEAASSGRPIVTTDVPGCRDVVSNGLNGLIVPVQQPAALAAALEKLALETESRQSMGRAGRELVVQKFSTSIVNSSTLKVYQDLAGDLSSGS